MSRVALFEKEVVDYAKNGDYATTADYIQNNLHLFRNFYRNVDDEVFFKTIRKYILCFARENIKEMCTLLLSFTVTPYGCNMFWKYMDEFKIDMKECPFTINDVVNSKYEYRSDFNCDISIYVELQKRGKDMHDGLISTFDEDGEFTTHDIRNYYGDTISGVYIRTLIPSESGAKVAQLLLTKKRDNAKKAPVLTLPGDLVRHIHIFLNYETPMAATYNDVKYFSDSDTDDE